MMLAALADTAFGHWRVIEHVTSDKGTRWLCRCVCGASKVFRPSDLRSGRSKSCGCHGIPGRGPKPPRRPRGGPSWEARANGEFIYCGIACLKDNAGAVAIPLSDGSLTWVDEEDFPLAASRYWFPRRGPASKTAYANSTHPITTLHRVIMDARPEQQVDHADWDGLNNRRKNLRFATSSQNIANYPRPLPRYYRGVAEHGPRFRARIQVLRQRITIGSFATAIEAARAYDQTAKRIFGEFACLNFPDG